MNRRSSWGRKRVGSNHRSSSSSNSNSNSNSNSGGSGPPGGFTTTPPARRNSKLLTQQQQHKTNINNAPTPHSAMNKNALTTLTPHRTTGGTAPAAAAALPTSPLHCTNTGTTAAFNNSFTSNAEALFDKHELAVLHVLFKEMSKRSIFSSDEKQHPGRGSSGGAASTSATTDTYHAKMDAHPNPSSFIHHPEADLHISKTVFLQFFAGMLGLLGERLWHVCISSSHSATATANTTHTAEAPSTASLSTPKHHFAASPAGPNTTSATTSSAITRPTRHKQTTRALNFHGFLTGVGTFARGSDTEKLALIFAMFDLSQSGVIAKNHFRTMINALCFAADSQQTRQRQNHKKQVARERRAAATTTTTTVTTKTKDVTEPMPSLLELQQWHDQSATQAEALVEDAFPGESTEPQPLSFYEFARWIQDHPDVVKVLDTAFSPPVAVLRGSTHGVAAAAHAAAITAKATAQQNVSAGKGIRGRWGKGSIMIPRAVSDPISMLTPRQTVGSTTDSLMMLADPISAGWKVACPLCDASFSVSFCFRCGGRLRRREIASTAAAGAGGAGSGSSGKARGRVTPTSSPSSRRRLPACAENALECRECGDILMGGVMRFCLSCGGDFCAAPVAAAALSASYNGSSDGSHTGEVLEPALTFYERQLRRALILNSPTAAIEGNLRKVGAKLGGIKRRFYRLRDNFLFSYYKASDALPLSVLWLENCLISPINNKKKNSKLEFGIEIAMVGTAGTPRFMSDVTASPGDASSTIRCLYAESLESRDRWLNALRLCSNQARIEDFYKVGDDDIGVGKFSCVRVAVHRKTGRSCAVKIIDKSLLGSGRAQEALRAEVAILKLLDHPHIVRLDAVYETSETLSLVMPAISGGDLFDRLVLRKRYPEHACRRLVHSLLDAIRYLHFRGIVHRDLKPENVLLRSEHDDTDIVLCDFGLASFMVNEQQKGDLQCGTLQYIAPEMLASKGYDKKVDMWAVGVIMFLLLEGKLPFDGDTAEEVLQQVNPQNGRLGALMSREGSVWMTVVSSPASDLLQALLSVDPEARPTVEQALQHPWFTGSTVLQK